MKRLVLVGLIAAILLSVGSVFAAPEAEYSEELVMGRSKGNRALNCTVIRPWGISSDPGNYRYPVIVWANGWGGSLEDKSSTTDWYKEWLIEWVLDGPYIVVAANQWSVRESDVLQCLEWVLDQNNLADSEYDGVLNTGKVALAGHSQGGGAVIFAGDGIGDSFDFRINSVVAMNPWGPNWVGAESQDGPVMIVTGAIDETTPERYTYPVYEAIQTNGIGGLYTVLQGAGHNDVGLYQEVVLLWWQYRLNNQTSAGKKLKRILGKDPWHTLYAEPFGF